MQTIVCLALYLLSTVPGDLRGETTPELEHKALFEFQAAEPQGTFYFSSIKNHEELMSQ